MSTFSLKKAYGYNVNSGNVEESRVTENIPNSADVKFRDSEFQFKYPYVNMKYHFDNRKLRFETDKTKNETLYKSIYGYYSQNIDDVEVLKKNIKQIIFPRYVKHTKYSTRHRHFFASKFWAKGENDLYNSDISETGSYYRLDEQGRRETNVTASLFAEGSLNSQIKEMMDLGHLTNIIPSQSIWDMDSRTNFTTSDPQTAASDSDGAPGVLQNQDHHFHNGLKTLLVTGSAATGSFRTKGATVFGTPSSGSFRVQGMVPTGIKATGSFEVTGATVFGTPYSSSFYLSGAHTPGVSASMTFDVIGAQTPGTAATAVFEMSGANYPGEATTGQFTLDGAYSAGSPATGTFDFYSRGYGGVRESAMFTIKPVIEDDATPGTGLDPDYLYFGSNHHQTGVRFFQSGYYEYVRLWTSGAIPSDTSETKYVPIFEVPQRAFLGLGDHFQNTNLNHSWNYYDNGYTLSFWLSIRGLSSNGDAWNNTDGDGYIFLAKNSSGTHLIRVVAERTTDLNGADGHLKIVTWFDDDGGGANTYRRGRVSNVFKSNGNPGPYGDSDYNHVLIRYSGGAAGTYTVRINGVNQTVSHAGTANSADTSLGFVDRYHIGDTPSGVGATDIKFGIDEMAIYSRGSTSDTPSNDEFYDASGYMYYNPLLMNVTYLEHFYKIGDGDDTTTSFKDTANSLNPDHLSAAGTDTALISSYTYPNSDSKVNNRVTRNFRSSEDIAEGFRSKISTILGSSFDVTKTKNILC